MVVLAMTDLGAARGAGNADWELEEFFRRREIDGTLAVLRRHGCDLASKRRRRAQETESAAIESSRTPDAGKMEVLSEKISATLIVELKESPSASSLSPSDRLSGFEGDEWDDRWTDTEDGTSSTYSDGVDSDGFRLEDLTDVPPPTVCFSSSTGGQGADGDVELPGFETNSAVTESAVVATTPCDCPTRIPDGESPIGTDLLPSPVKVAQAAAACIGSADIGSRRTDSGPLQEQDVASCDHFDDGVVADGSAVTAADLQAFLERLRIPEAALESHGWQHLITRATPTMQYSSHSHDCAIEGYPKSTCYRGRMVVEGVTLEAVRDFLLDDEFRGEWDENRLESTVLEDWNNFGVSIIRWVRRLPFFLRNREYVVSRRVWSLAPQSSSQTFFCINRNTSHPSAVSRPSLLRVPYFYSSWRIRYVPSEEERDKLTGRRDELKGEGDEAEGSDAKAEGQGARVAGHGRKLGVEIVTYHQEESGLPRELARVAVVRGMWGHMLRIEAALRSYCQAQRTVRQTLPPFMLTMND
ncbi:unnamed protein product [Closterium sp. Yama58-4]|nr:unnamed protein product [Closterium sp. Yama58-4]